MLRTILIVSLSVNIFVFSSLAMYGTWLVTGWVSSTFWRGVTSLFIWIVTFGGGAIGFWRIIEMMSKSSAVEARTF